VSPCTAGGGFEVGDRAPSFSVVTSAGSTFSLPARKPAGVFFMAGWCGTCIPEAQALAAIDKEFGDRVAIVAVSADPTDSPAALRRFADAARYGFAHDKDGTLATAVGVRSLDMTVVVDSEGRIVFRDAVPTGEATLRRALSRAGLA
jgi:peroxiredoxin